MKNLFSKATPVFTKLSSPVSGWLAAKRNTPAVISASRGHQQIPVNGRVYGLLVSGDATLGR